MDYILTSTQNKTTTITINRPEVYNALNAAAKIEIIQAIREANKDKDVCSIILTGAGKAFSSGQDLGDRNVQGDKVDLGHTLETEWNPLINAIRGSRKIIIGAINGVAAGAGLSVAMSCDLIVAKTGTKFVSGFSGLGLAPDAGSSFTFVKALGYQKTLEFFLLGKPMMAEQLLGVGMINQVSDDYLASAEELAMQLNSMAPLSLELIKKNLQQAQELSFLESMDRETQTQRFLGASNDYQEGLKAFFEKRKPLFTGA
jgi:2-(1,2-epoxy-1,2-dihydrophenyl)acetyl-CoA isomerase